MNINMGLEAIATSACLLNVYLAARANIWNFFFGVIAVSLYALIFFQARLYADMCLQMIFLLAQCYGWYQWCYGGNHHTALSVRRADTLTHLITAAALGSLFFLIASILTHYTDSTTIYQDSFITASSLVAQWMMSKKYLENWYWWIGVNIISIDVYFNKHLYFTTILYIIFLYLCLSGYRIWRNTLIHTMINLHRHATMTKQIKITSDTY